jgi:hypothetical protein
MHINLHNILRYIFCVCAVLYQKEHLGKHSLRCNQFLEFVSANFCALMSFRNCVLFHMHSCPLMITRWHIIHMEVLVIFHEDWMWDWHASFGNCFDIDTKFSAQVSSVFFCYLPATQICYGAFHFPLLISCVFFNKP